MSKTEQRIELVERATAEVLNREQLRRSFAEDVPLRHYIGFEISGHIHLGTGLMAMAKVRDFAQAGIDCTILLADWHTWINDKLGGDIDTIRRLALSYFAEGLKASLACVGARPDDVRFVLGTDLYRGNDAYWQTVIEVSRHTSLARMMRSLTILGRHEGESVDFAKLIYPAMQVADIFALGVHVAHAGMDQRKAHVIALDTAMSLSTLPLRDAQGQKIKPVAVHHPLIMGLTKPRPVEGTTTDDDAQAKMSKSDPNSAIFVHDDPETIARKIRKAYCPPDSAADNPLLNWARHLVFGAMNAPLQITSQQGVRRTYVDPGELETDYLAGAVHPGDLKNAIREWLIDVLAPAREHFGSRPIIELQAEVDHLSARR